MAALIASTWTCSCSGELHLLHWQLHVWALLPSNVRPNIKPCRMSPRVALALDAHMQPEAASALGAYLAKDTSGGVQQPGPEGAAPQLSSQQFAMAAQMYAIEVLQALLRFCHCLELGSFCAEHLGECPHAAQVG